ncbi:hypothetical protein [Asticcacaulis endophyticus]|uniref:Uncharacterized protein n=1 Tax=Asticcacaulis endophyticus TaxID=1395890 RepID=A0A918PTC1_9CAUL|nr:hypothetical protein [Asticcacaulis endophyticus]GGZ22028.1 hypothetical protein GCM10011273_03550 [Asticcacaulis endophyticus]
MRTHPQHSFLDSVSAQEATGNTFEAPTRRISVTEQRDIAVEALREAKTLVESIEQTTLNVWFVTADDPESAVCGTNEKIDAALKACGVSE